MTDAGEAPVSPEAELALLLAGTRARRDAAAQRIAGLAARVDQNDLAAFLMQQRLMLLVGARLVDLAPDALSERFRARLSDARTRARRRAMLFAAAGRHLAEELERAGIAALELKGASLAADLYGDEALRAYADIDLLVTVDDLDRAVAVADGLGWTELATTRSKAGLPPLHHALRRPDGTLPDVELHWRIHWYETAFAAGLLERSRIVDGMRRPRALDQLAALLLFYARDGFAGLRLVADIAGWWDRYATPDTLPGLIELCGEHPALADAWRVALAVAASAAGLPTDPLPPELCPRGRRAALACRLSNWDLRGDADQIMANVNLVDGLLTPRADLARFVHRQTILRNGGPSTPPPRLRGGAGAERSLHFTKMVVRHAIALARLRGGRSWSVLPPVAGLR